MMRPASGRTMKGGCCTLAALLVVSAFGACGMGGKDRRDKPDATVARDGYTDDGPKVPVEEPTVRPDPPDPIEDDPFGPARPTTSNNLARRATEAIARSASLAAQRGTVPEPQFRDDYPISAAAVMAWAETRPVAEVAALPLCTAEHVAELEPCRATCDPLIGHAISPSACRHLEARDCRGAGIVHLAVERGDLGVLQALVTVAPGLIELPDGLGRTPLLVAFGEGKVALAKALAQKGAKVEARAADGTTALHALVRFGLRTDIELNARREAVGAMLKAIGDDTARSLATAVDRGGRTPLMLAVRAGAGWLVGLLSPLGRPPAQARADTPLHVLARHADRFGSLSLARAAMRRLMLDGDAPDAVSSRGLTVLGEAIAFGEPEATRKLIPALVHAAAEHASGDQPLSVGPVFAGWPAARLAMWLGQVELASALVAAGAPSDTAWEAATQRVVPTSRGEHEWSTIGPDGLSPAHYAAFHGNVVFLRRLHVAAPGALSVVASARALDHEQRGWTVWHAAVAGADGDIVQGLARLGGPIEALKGTPDAYGRTPEAINGWRMTRDVRQRGPRDLADLRGDGAGFALSGFGHGGGGDADPPEAPPIPRASQGARGPAHEEGWSFQQNKPTESAQPEAEGHTPKRSAFTTLGFGGAYQVREYPVDNDFVADWMPSWPSPGLEAAGLWPAQGADFPARATLRSCLRGGRHEAAALLAASHLADVELADPFDVGHGAEALLLAARVRLMAPSLDADATNTSLEAVASVAAVLRRLRTAVALRDAERGASEHTAVASRAWGRAAASFMALIGATRLDRGEFAEAERALALGRRDGAGEPQAEGVLLGHLGRLLTETGRYQAALDALAESLRLRQSTHGEASAESIAAEINIGVVFDLLARHDDAQRVWAHALETLTRGEHTGLSVSLYGALIANNLGRVALFEGDRDLAEQFLNLAADALHATPNPPMWLGGRLALSLGDLAATDPTTESDAEPAHRDARIDAARAYYKAAITSLEAAHGPDHPLLGRAIWRLADMDRYDPPSLEARADADDTRRNAYARAFVMTRTSPEERWPLSFAWSRFEAERGQDAAAYFLARAALTALATLRPEVAAEGEMIEGEWLTERLEVYRASARLALGLGRPADAVAILGLKEFESHAAFTRGQANRPARDLVPMSLDERAAAQVAEPGASGAPLAEDALRTRVKDVREFLRKLEVLRPDVRASSATLEEQAKAARAMQSTLGRIGDGVVWVHLIPTDDAISAVITTADKQFSRTHGLGGAPVSALVEAFLDVVLGQGANPEVAAHALYAAVFEPFRADLAGAKTLYIAGEGALRDLPFAALHDGQRWLIESFAFVTASALTSAHLEREPPPLADWRVAGFGVSKAHVGFPALPGVTDELAGVIKDPSARGGRGVFPGEVLLDEAFEAEELLHALEEGAPPGVFIASHFKLGASDADSFVLTGDGGHLSVACIEDCHSGCLEACEDSDGFSFRDVHLAVFSACQTAQQMVKAREGRKKVRDTMSSLADVAAVLGAHAVLGTLWPVNDPSTAAWMRAFFGRLHAAGGRGKARAVQETCAAMARGEIGDGTWKHPYFWAPFVLLGNAR